MLVNNVILSFQAFRQREPRTAAPNLSSNIVKKILATHFVKPAIEKCGKVLGYRLHWPKQTEDTEKMIWQQIVNIRNVFDDMVKQFPFVSYFVSAICGINNKRPGQTEYRITPSVCYWIVSRDSIGDLRAVFDRMNDNPYHAVAKMTLQPYQNTEKDISNALFNSVKDNVQGCVGRLVEESVAHCQLQSVATSRYIAKIFNTSFGPRESLEEGVRKLEEIRFNTLLVDI